MPLFITESPNGEQEKSLDHTSQLSSMHGRSWPASAP